MMNFTRLSTSVVDEHTVLHLGECYKVICAEEMLLHQILPDHSQAFLILAHTHLCLLCSA